MANELIRFSCPCGKRLAAPPKRAGQTTSCPKCGSPVTVPADAGPPPEPPMSLEPAGPCSHPRLDEFYRVLLSRFAQRMDKHGVEQGNPTVRILLPLYRRQEVRLSVGRDRRGRDVLAVRSEIGTLSILEEALAALKVNRGLGKARLYLDDGNVLSIESLHRLAELDADEVAGAVEEIAARADEIEAKLFGVDVR
ncbi:MAG: hypothetical protein HY720_32970 [Planctomycetes bacterium]|nr:hypothetical protein [Planctomycetota bacterium]